MIGPVPCNAGCCLRVACSRFEVIFCFCLMQIAICSFVFIKVARLKTARGLKIDGRSSDQSCLFPSQIFARNFFSISLLYSAYISLCFTSLYRNRILTITSKRSYVIISLVMPRIILLKQRLSIF